jgi:DNA-binding PadR family transcriptional regulator
MGNVYRFIEPVVLLMLKVKGRSYGYDLASSMSKYALTDAAVERGALYRTLRQLEENGYVSSEWDVAGSGPARRVYSLTNDGVGHLGEWREVLGNLSSSMARFVKNVESATGK